MTKGSNCDSRGVSQSVTEAGSGWSETIGGTVYEPDILSSKERWYAEAGSQREATESVHEEVSLQDGRGCMLKDLLRKGDWMVTKDAYQ